MPTKSTHRWEEIKEFVPGCRATGTNGQLKCLDSQSVTSWPSVGRVDKLKERDPNIPKAPKQVKSGYKPPLIVTSTPDIPLPPPPTPEIKPVTLADDDFPEILLPPGYLSAYTEVEIITTRNVQNSDGTGHVFTSIETSFSVSVQAATSTKASAHNLGGDSKSPSTTNTETGINSHIPRLEHPLNPHQAATCESGFSSTTTGCGGQAARITQALILPACKATGVPPQRNHTPSFDLRKSIPCEEGHTTARASNGGKERFNTIDSGTSAAQKILPTPAFNWADDVFEGDEHHPRPLPLLCQGKGSQLNSANFDQEYPTAKGHRWADIITPVHSSHRGGPTALILTTVGVGADIFTGWETVTTTLTKKMLSVILEEPIHHGLKDTVSDVTNIAMPGMVEEVREGRTSGRLQNAEGTPVTVNKHTGRIPESSVLDGSDEQPAWGDAVMREITDPPDICSTLTPHEHTSAFPLILLLLWVSFILYPIAP